jgi:hypothetical protein
MKLLSPAILLLLGLVATTGPATARDQTAPQRIPEQSQPAQPPVAPGEGSSVPDRQGSLSNRLSQSRGVIEPPATGDSGVMPPPRTGARSTPVIPPPGSPEGSQKVRPK